MHHWGDIIVATCNVKYSDAAAFCTSCGFILYTALFLDKMSCNRQNICNPISGHSATKCYYYLVVWYLLTWPLEGSLHGVDILGSRQLLESTFFLKCLICTSELARSSCKAAESLDPPLEFL